MIEYVKVEKGNVTKTVEKQLLRQYISAGWKQVVEAKKSDNTSNTTYSSTAYSYDKK